MPDGERPVYPAVLSEAKRTGLAVPVWARQGAARAASAWATVQQRLSPATCPSRAPELGGAVIAVDTTAWQRVARSSQTPAFGIALIAALSVSWIGAATLSGSSDGQPPPAADGQPDRAPSGTVTRMRSADAPVDAARTDATQVDVSEDFLRNYAKIAAELDQRAGLDQVSVNPQPADLPLPGPLPGPLPLPLPGPEQSPNVPQATAEDPTAAPITTSVEEPSPPSTATTSGELPTVAPQPATDQPPAAEQAVPSVTTQPATEQPATPAPITAPGSGQAADAAG